ncbi:MAG: pyridoxamine 5'-phosphate oxidase family protein [Muribaculaceae bacterium]|nr:pyridoxamine 5'-phosphate oxidase family protein [Muribaculaceae bacterium]
MRKANREKNEDWALAVFDKAPYVTVSMIRPDGTPYGLPLSLVRDGNRTFYFHCAGEGEKLDCLRHSPTVSLSAVSKCTPIYEEEKKNFTEHYHSAIAIGRAEEVRNREEKIKALKLICERFLPKFMAHFNDAIARSLDRTTIIKIALTEAPVGKCKE